MRHSRWVALIATIVLATAGTSAVAVAQGSGGDKPTASDVGITAKEIRIAVIADVETPLAPGLFQGSVDAVNGWAKYVNKNGGIAGRKVAVDFIDSKLNADETRNAFITACENDFAVVGASALFVNNVDDIEGCIDGAGAATGLPDLAVVTTELVQQCSPTTFGINPPQIICDTATQSPQTYQANAGRYYFYKKNFGNDLHGAYVYSGDLKAAKNANKATMGGMQELGIKADSETDVSSRAPQSALTPIIQSMKDQSSNYFQSGAAFNTTVSARKEAKLQGLTDPKIIWDCTLQCYDKRLLEQGGADVEGQYVSLLFLPFEDAKTNPMLANFLKFTGPAKADGFGIQAWASGLLFQQAAEAAVKKGGVNGLTRKALFTELNAVKDFDGDGIIGTTNVGARETSPCYVLMQVKSSKFVRVWPKKAGTFDCKARNRVELKLDLLGG